MNNMRSIDRREFLKFTTLSSLGVCAYQAICRSEAAAPASNRIGSGASNGMSLIILWLDGGPSQLETFDPHPGTQIGGPTKAVNTCMAGVQFAAGLPLLAQKMDRLALIRSVVGTESDHERAKYLIKTGYPVSASLVYPVLGSICAAQLPRNGRSLPPYVSINSSYPAQAAYLGEQFNPFGIGDPKDPPQNLKSRVSSDRLERRIRGLGVIERELGRRDPKLLQRTLGLQQTEQALAMMSSEEMAAFAYRQEPIAVRSAYGDTPFGRGCLVARRLVEAGVRCIEVQSGDWDTHADNFNKHALLTRELDPAFSSLLTDLEDRGLLESTVVVCLGEFGRTPRIQGKGDGRDHWPHGFSVVLAGGRIRRGVVVGATDPAGVAPPTDPVRVPDLFATILYAMGINPSLEIDAGDRPIKLSEGTPVDALVGRS